MLDEVYVLEDGELDVSACVCVRGYIKRRLEEEQQGVSLEQPKFQLESRNDNHKKEKRNANGTPIHPTLTNPT